MQVISKFVKHYATYVLFFKRSCDDGENDNVKEHCKLQRNSNYLSNLLFAVNWVKFQVKIRDHIKNKRYPEREIF